MDINVLLSYLLSHLRLDKNECCEALHIKGLEQSMILGTLVLKHRKKKKDIFIIIEILVYKYDLLGQKGQCGKKSQPP